METAATLNNSGIALTEANRPDDAIPLFIKALVMEPDNPLLWLNLGVAQQRIGSYDEAMDSFHKAIGIDDGLAEAWLSMGLIYYESREFGLSEECYFCSLACDDSNPKTWNNLGVLRFANGDYEDARGCFEEAVSLSPHFYDALFNIRDTCRMIGDHRAADEFERALSGLSDGKAASAHPGFGREEHG